MQLTINLFLQTFQYNHLQSVNYGDVHFPMNYQLVKLSEISLAFFARLHVS